jgi:hypothetical protein
MERVTVMVREYTSIEAFKADEQKLGQEGWSAEATPITGNRPSSTQHNRPIERRFE